MEQRGNGVPALDLCDRPFVIFVTASGDVCTWGTLCDSNGRSGNVLPVPCAAFPGGIEEAVGGASRTSSDGNSWHGRQLAISVPGSRAVAGLGEREDFVTRVAVPAVGTTSSSTNTYCGDDARETRASACESARSVQKYRRPPSVAQGERVAGFPQGVEYVSCVYSSAGGPSDE